MVLSGAIAFTIISAINSIFFILTALKIKQSQKNINKSLNKGEDSQKNVSLKEDTTR